jgi:hemerythrin
MPVFVWTTEFEVGIPEIDDQHKELVLIANRLYEAVIARSGAPVVNGIFVELARATKAHFDFELKLLEQLHSTTVAEHRLSHDRLWEKIVGISSKIGNSQVTVGLDVMKLACELFVSHFLNVDKSSFDAVKAK